MKEIVSLNDLNQELSSNKTVWLLLYKKGSQQSDCAFENYEKAAKNTDNIVLYHADVNKVKDVHPAYKITSAPSLLNFENGQLRNIVKGCYHPQQFKTIFEKTAFTAREAGNEKLQKNVTIYTTPTCTWCNTVKRHLQEHGIRYQEIDVSANQKAAAEMVRKSGQQGVPQTDINGEIIVGFDRTKINSLLGIN